MNSYEVKDLAIEIWWFEEDCNVDLVFFTFFVSIKELFLPSLTIQREIIKCIKTLMSVVFTQL